MVAIRIIPAFAGNTNSLSFLLRRVQDHPRFRGEHTPATATMRSSRGSSPLSRGTHTRNGDYALQPRIIPAFAGNTFACSPTCRIRRDHPRFRGEHQKKEGRSPQIRGSSPLSRGTLGKKLRFSSPPRIIPAFAGNTTWGRYFYYNVVDHPRFRGEHRLNADPAIFRPGSSPLSRGTPITKDNGSR